MKKYLILLAAVTMTAGMIACKGDQGPAGILHVLCINLIS